MTRVFRSLAEWRAFHPSSGAQSLGFVPTMGALHDGHGSLVARAKRENQRVLASIFVNPTQFNDPGDLKAYPRTLDKDLEALERWGADYLLYPDYEELYPDSYRFKVSEGEVSRVLCGHSRPGHFDGVLTVVMKLLNIARADRAYFGEKDFQQYLLVRDMARAFFLETDIIPCPTVRERDGLAMSSRNSLLAVDARERAAQFPRLLRESVPAGEIRARLERSGFKVDYVEERFGRRFGAVQLDGVRLIDNVQA